MPRENNDAWSKFQFHPTSFRGRAQRRARNPYDAAVIMDSRRAAFAAPRNDAGVKSRLPLQRQPEPDHHHAEACKLRPRRHDAELEQNQLGGRDRPRRLSRELSTRPRQLGFDHRADASGRSIGSSRGRRPVRPSAPEVTGVDASGTERAERDRHHRQRAARVSTGRGRRPAGAGHRGSIDPIERVRLERLPLVVRST